MKIKFTTDENTLLCEEAYPIPAKKNLPNWFKNVPPHSVDKMTVKGCMPVLDSINSGYLLRLTQDMQIKYNWLDKEHDKRYSKIVFASNFKNLTGVELGSKDCHIQFNEEAHSADQLDGKGGFMATKNGLNAVFKIINPWIIKTPPGYSCLFLPPMHRELDHFHILPAIVDTDLFRLPVNFPFIFNKYKYTSFKETFEKGTPYVQVIPFKRDKWEMIIEKNDGQEKKERVDFKTTLLNYYKNKIRSKKEYL
jgi:hypothetical protein